MQGSFAQQVVDQRLGMDLFLDVQRRRVDDEVAPVLLVFAAPDELRIEIRVARLADPLGVLLLLFQHGLVFSRGDVFALGLLVLEGGDSLGGDGFLDHEIPAQAFST